MQRLVQYEKLNTYVHIHAKMITLSDLSSSIWEDLWWFGRASGVAKDATAQISCTILLMIEVLLAGPASYLSYLGTSPAIVGCSMAMAMLWTKSQRGGNPANAMRIAWRVYARLQRDNSPSAGLSG